MIDIEEYIEGKWHYYPKERILKHLFAKSSELRALNLIDAEGYLPDHFKNDIIAFLGSEMLANAIGPFGDDDIFSGEINEDETYYYIEIHQCNQHTLDNLKQFSNVEIIEVDHEPET